MLIVSPNTSKSINEGHRNNNGKKINRQPARYNNFLDTAADDDVVVVAATAVIWNLDVVDRIRPSRSPTLNSTNVNGIYKSLAYRKNNE